MRPSINLSSLFAAGAFVSCCLLNAAAPAAATGLNERSALALADVNQGLVGLVNRGLGLDQPHAHQGVVRRRKHKTVVSRRKRASKACRAVTTSNSTEGAGETATMTATVDRFTASVTMTATVTDGSPAAASSTSTSTSSLAVQNGIKTGSASVSSTHALATTTASATASATPTKSTTSFKSAWPAGNGPFAGQTTYYDLGMDGSSYGACGTSLIDTDLIAAASYQMFDNWPGATANPNLNPICKGVYANVTYNGNSVVVRIEDRCPGCTTYHLDLSPKAFTALAPESQGLMNVEWSFVEGYGN